MSKKKFYAVKSGRKTGIFTSWAECSASVLGFSNSIYKGFETEIEAYEFLGMSSGKSKKTSKSKKEDKQLKDVLTKKDKAGYDVLPIRSNADVVSYKKFVPPECVIDKYEFITFVDGSYDKVTKIYGSGVIVLNSTQDSYDVYSKAGHDEWDQWNIVGELEAVKLAITKAQEQNKSSVAIYHDLKNISLWATGEWKARNRYTQEYVRFIEEASKTLSICFVKVKGHSNESIYNDLSDKAAKKAIIDYNK